MGCPCFVANVGEKDKFAPRAHQHTFLGYTLGFKGYKLYDLQTKKIFHSKGVSGKNIFPFKTGPTQTSTSLSEGIRRPILPHLSPLALLASPKFSSFHSILDIPQNSSTEHSPITHT